MAIEIIGDNSPRINCGNCKKSFKIDIKPFQADISRVAKFRCPHCKTDVFTGLIVLGNTHLPGLLDQIQSVIQLFQQSGGSVEQVGKGGENIKPTLVS